LQTGSSGDDVRKLQFFLNSNGFILTTEGPGSPGIETNIFGFLTRASLIRFQIANNIQPAVGYFGPKTRERINSLFIEKDLIQKSTDLIDSSEKEFDRNLSLGMMGDDVLRLQRFLNRNKFIVALSGPGSIGNETVKFGFATQNALRLFQKAKNISPAAGYFGPITRNIINSSL
jgi:peptidoglycan hydrolase-like protein with peptidoglycan-binding domain